MRFRRLLTLFLPIVAAAACGGGDLVLPSDGASPRLQLVRGSEQVGITGTPLGDPVVVRLIDGAEVGIAARTVTWLVSGGGGSVSPGVGTTDAAGLASATWILGPDPGSNTLDAVVSGVGLVTFRATGRSDAGAGASADRSRVSASPASIPAGTGIATVTVRVLDDNGDPVEGAAVTLAATGEGNTLTQPAGPTGADGIVTGTLQSTEPGAKTVSATVDGVLGVTETAAIVVMAVVVPRVESIEGDNQSAPAGGRVPVRPAIRALDQQGQPMAGVAVTFVVTGGGGSVDEAAQTTNADGIARSGDWTLGSAAGTNTLEARAGMLQGSPVVFQAEGTAGTEIDHFVFQVGPPDVDEGEFFSVQVAMVDAGGQVVPVSGIEIYLGLFRDRKDKPTNEDLLGERFVRTEGGVAAFTIAVDKKGRYRLRALSDELPELGPNGPEPFLLSDPFEVR